VRRYGRITGVKDDQIPFYFRTLKALFVSECDQGGGRGERVKFMFGSVYLKVWVRMGE